MDKHGEASTETATNETIAVAAKASQEVSERAGATKDETDTTRWDKRRRRNHLSKGWNLCFQ